jgi:hemolysin activation/secretion protein
VQQRYLLASILMCGVSFPAFAQDAGSLLRDKERAGETPKLPTLPKEEVDTQPPPPSAEAETAQTVRIKTVRFDGSASLLTEAQRTQLAGGIEGTDVGLAGISALAEGANTALRQNGYLLARAIIPPQDATEGVLTVSIIEGALEDIVFNYDDSVRTNPEIFTATANRYVDRQSLNKNDLETALLRMNDLPGVTARSRLAPGEAAGTTKLIVDVSQAPVFSGSLNGDNYGSPSTGRAQGHAQIGLTDITGSGDLTRLGLTLSEGQRYASASLAMPISTSGLLATFDYGYLHYENIDAVGEAAGLEGSAHYGSIGLTHRAIRSRDHNLNLSATLNGKVLRDDSTAGRLSDKRIFSGTLEISGDTRDTFGGGGINQVSASWTVGALDLSNLPSAEFVDALTFKTQGTFHRLNADVARLQKLPGNFSLYASMSGQWANKNLDSSESFSLGGPYGVRGWPVGEARGDKGLLGTAELRYDAPIAKTAGTLQLAGFFDAGRIWVNDKSFGIPPVNACSCNSYSLSSVGVNATWRRNNINLSVGWSHGLGSNPGRSAFGGTNADGGTGRQQFWLSGSVRF